MAKRNIQGIAIDSKVCGERCILIAFCDDGTIWRKEIKTCDCQTWTQCEDIPPI